MYASDSNFSLTCVTNRPRTCCETIRGDWVQTINGEFSIMPQRYCDATCFQLEYGGKWKFFVMTDTQFWRQVVLLSGKRIGNASTCYFPLRINSKKNKKKKNIDRAYYERKAWGLFPLETRKGEASNAFPSLDFSRKSSSALPVRKLSSASWEDDVFKIF